MKKVLIISATGMGDSLWGTPGIRALKKAYPEIEIDLIVSTAWKPLFEFNPHLSKIFEYQEQWYCQPLLGIQLLGRYYDAILIFHANRNFKRVIPWLRSTPTWYHQNFNWLPESYRVEIKTHVHGIQRRLIMLEKLGVKADGGQMEIFLDPAALDRAQKLLHKHDFISGKYIYLNLGAAVEGRRWMPDRFTALAKRILEKTSCNIILGGGPHEKSRGHAVLSQIDSPRAIEVCDQPLMVNASLIAQARLMVTSDTGPMHIGFAMKTPIVALFGSISPLGSGPHEIPENRYKIIEIDPAKTGSAGKPDSPDFLFSHITVDKVWHQVEKLLAQTSSP